VFSSKNSELFYSDFSILKSYSDDGIFSVDVFCLGNEIDFLFFYFSTAFFKDLISCNSWRSSSSRIFELFTTNSISD